MFKHLNCGGPVVANLARQLKLVTPGLSITLEGIKPGVLELQQLERTFCGYLCLKCHESIEEDKFGELVYECFACSHNRPVEEIIVTDVVPPICNDCLDVITGKKEPKTEQLKKVKSILALPPNFKQETLLNIMKKPVSL